MTVVAQLGCGYWGPNLLRNFLGQPGCRVKWLAETSPDRCRYVEANFPTVRTTPSWESVLTDKEVDAS